MKLRNSIPTSRKVPLSCLPCFVPNDRAFINHLIGKAMHFNTRLRLLSKEVKFSLSVLPRKDSSATKDKYDDLELRTVRNFWPLPSCPLDAGLTEVFTNFIDCQ